MQWGVIQFKWTIVPLVLTCGTGVRVRSASLRPGEGEGTVRTWSVSHTFNYSDVPCRKGQRANLCSAVLISRRDAARCQKAWSVTQELSTDKVGACVIRDYLEDLVEGHSHKSDCISSTQSATMRSRLWQRGVMDRVYAQACGCGHGKPSGTEACSDMPNRVWKHPEQDNTSPVLPPFFFFCQKNISHTANHSEWRYPVGRFHCWEIKWHYEAESISEVGVLKLSCATCHKRPLQCYVISQNSISHPFPASPRWEFISWL